MAGHFLETPEYKQLIQTPWFSISKSNQIYKIDETCRSVDPTTFTPPLTKISGSAPGDLGIS